MHAVSPQSASPWPHRWALALLCATFPLLWVGGLVTTTDAGMAVPDWPTTYGYNLLLYPWQTWLFGPWDLFIEHGHRLLGALVGLLTIGLLIVLWRCESRAWLRRLGLLALGLVILQGVLGGLRVRMDDRMLAMIHGCTGPLFFSLVTGLALFTSRWWRDVRPGEAASSSLPTVALLTCLLMYVQLILGATMRHVPAATEPTIFATAVKFHLLLAAVIVCHVFVALAAALRYAARRPDGRCLRRFAVLLALFTVLQVLLGAGTWAVKYSVAQWVGDTSWLAGYTIQAGSLLQTHITTAHMALGSLLLATATALALGALRSIPLRLRPAGSSLCLWGVAT